MYSVITFKSTRAPKLVCANFSWEEAVKKANDLYDQSKVLSDHGYLATGVSIIVMTDTSAELCVKNGKLASLHGSALLHQCGGF